MEVVSIDCCCGSVFGCFQVSSQMTRSTLGTGDAMVEDEIREAEEKLLTASVRSSPEALDRLISDQFVEFGSSGRVYKKDDIVAMTLAEPNVTVSVTDFHVLPVAPDVALATYRTGRSLRSSLWRREGETWQIVFHQGTPIVGP